MVDFLDVEILREEKNNYFINSCLNYNLESPLIHTKNKMFISSYLLSDEMFYKAVKPIVVNSDVKLNEEYFDDYGSFERINGGIFYNVNFFKEGFSEFENNKKREFFLENILEDEIYNKIKFKEDYKYGNFVDNDNFNIIYTGEYKNDYFLVFNNQVYFSGGEILELQNSYKNFSFINIGNDEFKSYKLNSIGKKHSNIDYNKTKLEIVDKINKLFFSISKVVDRKIK